MTQFYFDPARESELHALPNAETFYAEDLVFCDHCGEYLGATSQETCWLCGAILPIPEKGWYYWACFPGCLPDSDPVGPFETEEEAISEAQNW